MSQSFPLWQITTADRMLPKTGTWSAVLEVKRWSTLSPEMFLRSDALCAAVDIVPNVTGTASRYLIDQWTHDYNVNKRWTSKAAIRYGHEYTLLSMCSVHLQEIQPGTNSCNFNVKTKTKSSQTSSNFWSLFNGTLTNKRKSSVSVMPTLLLYVTRVQWGQPLG